MAVLACTGVASAASFTVNDTADASLATSTDTNCVSSQPGGTCTLRAAVEAANNVGGASTITVPAGTYVLTTDNQLDVNSPDKSTSITVTGVGSASTVIDGVDNTSIFFVDPNGGLSLSGLTLQNGNSDEGGAIYSEGATAVTADVLFKGNFSFFAGGAIYSDSLSGSTLSLNGATFKGNATGNFGGAVYDDSSAPTTITNSTFFENTTFGCSDGCGPDFGGAIYADNGPLNVDHSSFSSNLSGAGGAIAFSGFRVFSARQGQPVAGSPVSITNSSFVDNSAQSLFGGCVGSRKASPSKLIALCGGAPGGALYDDFSGGLTATGNLFNGNTALAGGAAYLSSAGGYTLNADEFDNNTAKTLGGAVDWENGALSATGSSFIGNASADEGGAMFLDSGALLTLVNATFDGNSAAFDFGAAMYVATATPATLTNDTIAHNTGGDAIENSDNFELTNGTDTGNGISNTVIANNVGGDCSDNFATGFDVGFNLDSDTSCLGTAGATGDKAGVDSKLGAPADNGGSVLTDAELAGSPAIDGGTNTGCPSTDARGIARPQGASCDIGAYELAPANLALTKTAPASAVQGAAFTYTLTVTNGGPGTSTGTTLVDQLPAGETFYGATPAQGTCTTAGSPANVTCSLGNVNAGASVVVTVVVSESNVGPVSNTATTTNDQSSSATATATTNVTASSPASGGRPQAITGNTTGITSTKATIHGQVIPNGTATQYFFQYGKGKAYGNVTTPQQVSSTTNVSAALSHLANATRYHYRLVAINGNGTSDGNDRTFKTKGHRFLGSFVLDNPKLHVRNGRVYAMFTCKSSIACLSRFSIVIHARIASTHRLAVLDFTTTRQSPRHWAAHQTRTVSAPVSPGALAYLEAAANGQIGGKISARPRTNQHGLIELIELILG
ncbi:MAG: choice-of-anchor Q domain-containing protein [Solirubrobacteraceae bacterium]